MRLTNGEEVELVGIVGINDVDIKIIPSYNNINSQDAYDIFTEQQVEIGHINVDFNDSTMTVQCLADGYEEDVTNITNTEVTTPLGLRNFDSNELENNNRIAVNAVDLSNINIASIKQVLNNNNHHVVEEIDHKYNVAYAYRI